MGNENVDGEGFREQRFNHAGEPLAADIYTP
jgi:hypothetical protein